VQWAVMAASGLPGMDKGMVQAYQVEGHRQGGSSSRGVAAVDRGDLLVVVVNHANEARAAAAAVAAQPGRGERCFEQRRAGDILV
jgi:hypothetical protein